MFFKFGIMGKTVRELRKNQGLTAKELAERVRVDTIEILKVDEMRLKEVPEPLKERIYPILSGEYMDKIPW
ncbi:MAG: helix-turn-helix domain-containing protein [Firmicutes bacterium]|nr:helix-turn-helix domain-containing protein [Bacillota bacterium]